MTRPAGRKPVCQPQNTSAAPSSSGGVFINQFRAKRSWRKEVSREVSNGTRLESSLRATTPWIVVLVLVLVLVLDFPFVSRTIELGPPSAGFESSAQSEYPCGCLRCQAHAVA